MTESIEPQVLDLLDETQNKLGKAVSLLKSLSDEIDYLRTTSGTNSVALTLKQNEVILFLESV